MNIVQKKEQQLFADIRQMIDEAWSRISKIVASGVTALYWIIGTRINIEILNNQRA